MPRLIDADALYDRLAFKRMGDMRRNLYPGIESAIAQLKKAPTIEAEPVRHGRWERTSVLVGCMKWEYFYECTACGRSGENYKTHYCPNCGAKMDGDQ